MQILTVSRSVSLPGSRPDPGDKCPRFRVVLIFPGGFFYFYFLCVSSGSSSRVPAAGPRRVHLHPDSSSFCLSLLQPARFLYCQLAPALTSCQDQGDGLTNHRVRWLQRLGELGERSHSTAFSLDFSLSVAFFTTFTTATISLPDKTVPPQGPLSRFLQRFHHQTEFSP